MARRLRAVLAGALSFALSGCQDEEGAHALPPFAAALPGHTAVVAWAEPQGDVAALLPASLVAGLPSERIGLTLVPSPPPGVRAWLADPRAVGWSSLAGNQHFRAAAAEFAPTRGTVFVDLQQTIDAARAALAASTSSDTPMAGLRDPAQERVWRALRLDALEWMVVRPTSDSARSLEAVVASGEAERGLLAFLAAARPTPVSAVPTPAAFLVRGTFAPAVLVAAIRELLADAGEGPLAALQQMVQGTGVQAGIDALGCLDGAVVALAGPDWVWAAAGVRDAVAAEAALDAFAVARGGHWLAFGRVRIELDDAVLRVSVGDVPAARRPLDSMAVSLHVQGAAPPFEVTATRTGARLRLHARRP